MKFLSLVLALAVLQGCSFATPEAGQVAVMVKKPYLFGSDGVEQTVYTTGRHLHALSTSSYTLAITPMQVKENFNDLLTADNVPVDFNAYLKFQISETDAWKIYDQFGGKGWYQRNLKERFRTQIRSFVKTQPLFKLTTDQTVIKTMQTKIKGTITEYVTTTNLPITVMEVIIGKASPPDAVVKQTEATAAQKQRLKTEAQRTLAEKARKHAETAKAEADKAYLSRFGMNISQYLQLRQLEIEEQRIEMAKSKANVNVIMGNAQPMFSVTK